MEKAKKLLVVEDDDNLRRLITQALGKKYRLFEAADGNQAIEDVKKVHPDLILLDLMLPGKDGIEVCRRIRGHPDTKNIKIIMLTAQKNSLVKSAGLAAGADLFINKPFNMADLAKKVEELIG
jgi:DNA-binding response OmpR family regulator